MCIRDRVYSYLEEPFDFSAEAEEKTRVFIIHDFKKLFEGEVPEAFLKSYINLVSKKCMELSRTNQITSQSTLRQKIAKYLILNQDESRVLIDYSREEWADILATTRPSLSRELSSMVEDELITISNKTIEIVDIKALGEII